MKKVYDFLKKHSIIVVAVLGILAPLVITNTYHVHIILMCMMYGVLASSLNIAVGMTGLSNLAHATFFGIGAYAAAILNTRYGLPFYLTFFAGGLVAMVFGFILGAPTLRLKGVFLALVTTGFGQVIRIVELNWVSLTNGPMGISGIDAAEVGSYSFSTVSYIYYGLALLILCMYMSKRLMGTRVGRALFAIKYDETVARSLGVNITFYKVGAYVLSACMAGMAGSIFAHYVSFISPDTFTVADSTTVLCMVILGGAGSLLGPVIGAFILTIAPEIFRFAQTYRMIFIGAVMVIGVIANERGWVPMITSKIRGLFHKKQTSEEGGKA
ncbi:branched-chain amino acid ABC transporter permease [Qiania dongpingensis]|uniref:Branched-chain amino acid ABC transporter permease n=1 Tax=Qiania dongpingensis TaxID=2763669 RepID=A0A7G9G5B4_9FIRM|nr:branched-chain amino acid ABC transporter permease [Qiania dongpingensis]QNM05996.1 branched-chain amino acid ABC transporter permease [Qiania dongpingensis]